MDSFKWLYNYTFSVCIWPTSFVHSLIRFSVCHHGYLRNCDFRFTTTTEAQNIGWKYDPTDYRCQWEWNILKAKLF